MSRLNSKLVLRAMAIVPDSPTDDTEQKFEVLKSTNTLAHGVPGNVLTRKEVDTILKSAANRGPRNQLTVEFVK